MVTNSRINVRTVYTRIMNPPFHKKGMVNLVKSHREYVFFFFSASALAFATRSSFLGMEIDCLGLESKSGCL